MLASSETIEILDYIGIQIFDIIKCQIFPERALYDYMNTLLNNKN